MPDDWRAFVARYRASPIVALALASLLLAIPLVVAPGTTHLGLTWPATTASALLVLGTGWAIADVATSRRLPWWLTGSLVVALWLGGIVGSYVVFRGPGPGRTAALLLGPAIIVGAAIRGTRPEGRSRMALVALAAAALWYAYDVARLHVDPLRDLHLYVGTGADALAGRPVYLSAPLSVVPDPADLPFVYPPLTIPLFELLALLPQQLAEVAWVTASLGAVVAGQWLLGIRGRWLVVLLAWPPFAIGIAVGNVATFTFLLFALGFRVGAALVLAGAFKLQSAIPALWLIRERRWGSIVGGIAVLIGLVLVTLPLTDVGSWWDWVLGLGHFQVTTDRYPSMKGFAFTRNYPPVAIAAITLAMVALAFVSRGRTSLARLGAASVVASPTLYLHGLTPLLPGVLAMRTDVAWVVLGLSAGIGPPWVGWLAIAIVLGALLMPHREPLGRPDLSAGERELHPLGGDGVVWPSSNDR